MALVAPSILTRLISQHWKALYGHFRGQQGEEQFCKALPSSAELSGLMSMCWLTYIHAKE